MPSHRPKRKESFTSNLVAKITEVPVSIKKEDIAKYAAMKGKLVKSDGQYAYFRGFAGAVHQKDGVADGSKYDGVLRLELLSDEEVAVVDTIKAISLYKTKAPEEAEEMKAAPKKKRSS